MDLMPPPSPTWFPHHTACCAKGCRVLSTMKLPWKSSAIYFTAGTRLKFYKFSLLRCEQQLLKEEAAKSSFHSVYLWQKENQIFSYIRNFRMELLQSHIWLRASLYLVKYLRISSYIRKPFLIYDFATDPIWISLYMRKISFSFLSVCSLVSGYM